MSEAIEEPDDLGPDARNARDERILQRHCAQLREWFDSVQIVVTSHDEATGSSRAGSWGSGNWYTRFGSTKEWVLKKERQITNEQDQWDRDHEGDD